MKATAQIQADSTPKPSVTPVGTSLLQRKCACGGSPGASGECAECRAKRLALQRSATKQPAPFTAPPIVHEVLNTPGQSLDAATRAFMEPRFGHDFGQVRVHTDEKAAESANAVNAQAYTVGHDMVFGRGQYMPGSSAGQLLLAHELAHVVQQGGRRQYGAKTLFGSPTDVLEQEADEAATAVVEGRTVSIDERVITPLIQGQGTLSCALLTDPVTRMPTCVNMGGCVGTCVLHNNFPIPPYCTCEPTVSTPAPSQLPAPPPSIPTPTMPAPSTAPPAPAPAPPAPPPVPVVLRGVEVENSRDSITYRVPSSLGAAGRQHWVTAASLSGPQAVVRAIVDPVVPPADPRVAGMHWTVNGAPIAPSGDALHLDIPRNAGKKVVRATLGGNSEDLTIWAVFATLAPTGPADGIADVGLGLRVRTTVDFAASIIPSSIITDGDRPDLAGANTVNPPGGTNSCGNALAGGVDHRWDISRQIRMRNIDPAGHLPLGCVDTVGGAYPANITEGNDDAGTGDETNDPYAGGGQLTSTDTPTRLYPHAMGADGDTIEQHLHFREFARLEYNSTWWNIARFSPWRLHIRAQRVGGRWVDNGTDSALDNTGF